MRLHEICYVQTGYTTRTRLEPAAQGGILTIQPRDISSEGAIDHSRLSRTHLDSPFEKYLVRTGDLVFRSRGEQNTASALNDRFAEAAVAVLPLFILRPKMNLVEPTFLAWSINQPDAQKHFDRTARGTSMRMVPKSSLDSLELKIPDIQTQRRIVTIDELATRERELSLLLAEKKKGLVSAMLQSKTGDVRPAPNRGGLKND